MSDDMALGLLVPAACAAGFCVVLVADTVDRLSGFYAGWDPARDWSTRGAPWQRAKRRAHRAAVETEEAAAAVPPHERVARPALTAGQLDRLAITRAVLGDPDYYPDMGGDR